LTCKEEVIEGALLHFCLSSLLSTFRTELFTLTFICNIAGLRHVTRLAATYVVGIDRPLNSNGEDAATVAAKAATQQHGGGSGWAMDSLAVGASGPGVTSAATGSAAATDMEAPKASTRTQPRQGVPEEHSGKPDSMNGAPDEDARAPPEQGQQQQNECNEKEEEKADVPKLLADLVEAVIGGVLMDCDGGGGRGLVAAWQAYFGLACAAGMEKELRLVPQ
jgi:hypothetical protein